MYFKKGAAPSSTFLWMIIFPAIVVFMLIIAGSVVFLAAGKKPIKTDNIGLVDLKGYEITENFLNQEIEGMKLKDFIIYHVNAGDIRSETEILPNYKFSEPELKIKDLLAGLPKPIDRCGWGMNIGRIGFIRTIETSGLNPDKIDVKRFYKSEIYIDKNLFVRIYMDCVEAYSGGL